MLNLKSRVMNSASSSSTLRLEATNEAPAAESKSVNRLLAVGAFWALLGAVLSRGLTLASSIAAARILGTTGFGELGMIQNTQGLFGVLVGAGMGLAATKFVAEHRASDLAKAERYTGFAIFVAVASARLLAPLLFLFAGLNRRPCQFMRLTWKRSLQVSTGLLFFGTINGVQTGAIIGLGNFRTVAILNIFAAAPCALLGCRHRALWRYGRCDRPGSYRDSSPYLPIIRPSHVCFRTCGRGGPRTTQPGWS